MGFLKYFLYSVAFIFVFHIIVRLVNWLFSTPKSKADKKFKKLLEKFIRKKKRSPSKRELFKIIIEASHVVLKTRGRKGHFERQKIRKYLLEKYGVVRNYRIK